MAMRGKWYTNGVINKQFDILLGDTIPEGFYLGFTPRKRSKEEIEESNKKRKQTNLERYGGTAPLCSKEVQEKTKATNLKKYGVENPSQAQVVKNKKVQTSIERNGTEYYFQTDEFKEKSKQTNLERYGTENPNKSDIVKEKVKQTNLERYGVESYPQTKEFTNKFEQTNLKNLGVKYPMQSKEVQEKSKQTCMEKYGVDIASKSSLVKENTRRNNFNKYGVDNPSKLPEVQEKIKQTCLERYGVENGGGTPQALVKQKQTNLERYGVDSPAKVKKFQEKAKQTCLDKYGVDNPFKSKEIQNNIKQKNMSKYGYRNPMMSKEVQEKASKTCQEHYGYVWPCQRPEARKYSNDSGPNKEFAKLLESNNISYEREFHINSYSYDFKVSNILIEVNPYSTHNSLWGLFNRKGLESDYHQQKSQTAIEAGYHCIHIFDWDSKEKIVRSLIQDKETIYARQTTISGITKQEAKEFLNEYHLQGSCNGQEVILGLRDKYGELVSLMSFGKPRYNKNYQYELLRYCYSKQVIGGAEKLFKHFIKQYKPESIISYCDNSKFSGNVYKKLGFILKDIGSPSKHWYSPKTDVPLQHITDNLLRQRGYDQLFNESYGKGTSNEELIIKRGYVPVYDCGQSTYIWSK